MGENPKKEEKAADSPSSYKKDIQRFEDITAEIKEKYKLSNYDLIDILLKQRVEKPYAGKIKPTKPHEKTNIKIYNLTRQAERTKQLLDSADMVIVIAGVHTPGKYLSAVPGTLNEIVRLVEDIKCEKILTGPAVYGTSLVGGRFGEKVRAKVFDRQKDFDFSYDEIADYAVKGAEIIKQIPQLRIAEIETSKGCSRKKKDVLSAQSL